MSLDNSTASCMQKNSVKKGNMTITNQMQEQKKKEEKAMTVKK